MALSGFFLSATSTPAAASLAAAHRLSLMLFQCSRRIPELAQLVDAAQARGVKVNFIDEAVWIENTTLTFHVDDDEENADHGSRYSTLTITKKKYIWTTHCCACWLVVLPSHRHQFI